MENRATAGAPGNDFLLDPSLSRYGYSFQSGDRFDRLSDHDRLVHHCVRIVCNCDPEGKEDDAAKDRIAALPAGRDRDLHVNRLPQSFLNNNRTKWGKMGEFAIFEAENGAPFMVKSKLILHMEKITGS